MRTLGRRIAFWRSQNMRSKRGVGDFCGAETLITPYVLLRKTQSSVSFADSSFHCAAVGGSAALRMRRPPCGEKGPLERQRNSLRLKAPLAKGGRAAGRSPVAGDST